MSNTELTRQRALLTPRARVPAADFTHFRGGQFRVVSLLAHMQWGRSTATRSESPFGCAIVHVVGLGTQKQVVRPDTRGVVALVKHPEPRWDRAYVELPRKAMGINADALDAYFAIPIFGVNCSSPNPARRALLKTSKESFGWCLDGPSRHYSIVLRQRPLGLRR